MVGCRSSIRRSAAPDESSLSGCWDWRGTMAEGTIDRIVRDRGFGFIRPVDGGDQVFFHHSVLEGVRSDELREGIAVEYEMEMGGKGPRATIVRLSGGADEARGDFLNPYNFVRYLDQPRPQGHVLGDCPPPPHDRYVGLTGRITCELTAVTPLFVSDSHAVQGKPGEHRTFRFFQVANEDGKLEPALPATSLRGMVRSVFEVATNSCFAVFDNQTRLPYRDINAARRVKPGIVKSLASDGQPGLIALCREAAAGAYPGCKKPIVLDSSWRTGERAFAVIERSKRGVPFVSKLARTHSKPSRSERMVEGWLKITGQNIDRKLSERFFYRPDADRSLWVEFSLERQQDYNEILAQQRQEKGFASIHQHDVLTIGDLVYVELDGDNKTVKNIAATRVPRLKYRASIGELVPKGVLRCGDYDALCPACRVFGWVHEKASDPGKKERVAYAGRVRFSHGKLTHHAGTVDDPQQGITLAILSTPKPTTTQFYLLDRKGQPSGKVDYDTPDARLRGRKFYRHHGAEPSRHADGYEYERAGKIKDDQNRTVCGVLEKGTTFEFSVDFENLAPEELGALLWSLEMEEGMHHRLGYAKPLGFGSVTIQVKAVQVLQPTQRFSSLKNEGWATVTEKQREDWVESFKSQMMAAYGSLFEQLPNIQDLKALAGEPDVAQIHYPRLESEPQVEGENFRWFVKNKRQQPPHALDLAVDDRGLPLNPER
ncbi:MAG TPA: TIGR03986 family CRISPR-associated RAMP protein [Anaerolineae bacterium]|nr:TIGR03986 family CRISPR-associated RAMP protein [Anaerolineae bacterium]